MTSRLIDQFKKQTKNTILDYMDRLAVNHAVYSTHLKGYEPHLKEKNIYVRYWNKPRINNHLRISVGTDEEAKILINALEELLG